MKNFKNKKNPNFEPQLPSADMPDIAPIQDQGKYIVAETKEDDYGRRHWKVHEDAESKKQQDLLASIAPSITISLKKRTEDLKLDSMVGRRQNISKDMSDKEKSVYYCEICQCATNDSRTWLDHINGKNHNRLIGMNMKVEKVNHSQVKERFSQLSKPNKQPNKISQQLLQSNHSTKQRVITKEKLINQKEKPDIDNLDQIYKKIKLQEKLEENSADSQSVQQNQQNDDNIDQENADIIKLQNKDGENDQEKENNSQQNNNNEAENNQISSQQQENKNNNSEQEEEDEFQKQMGLLGLPTKFGNEFIENKKKKHRR